MVAADPSSDATGNRCSDRDRPRQCVFDVDASFTVCLPGLNGHECRPNPLIPGFHDAVVAQMPVQKCSRAGEIEVERGGEQGFSVRSHRHF
jgi:hypothetical protein